MKFRETCIPTNVRGQKARHKKSLSKLPFVQVLQQLIWGVGCAVNADAGWSQNFGKYSNIILDHSQLQRYSVVE